MTTVLAFRRAETPPLPEIPPLPKVEDGSGFIITLRGYVPLSTEALAEVETIFYALAPRTRKTYALCLRRYAHDGFELTGTSLAAWVSKARESGMAAGAIAAFASAIRKAAVLANRPIEKRQLELARISHEGRCHGQVSVLGGAGGQIRVRCGHCRGGDLRSRCCDWPCVA